MTFLNFIILEICLFLAVLHLCCYARAFSSCSEQGLLVNAVCRFLWRWFLSLFFFAVASLVAEHQAPRHECFSSYSKWGQYLWPTGLVDLRHVGSSQSRDRTCAPCVGRQIPNCWTTREIPTWHFFPISRCVMRLRARSKSKESRTMMVAAERSQEPGQVPMLVQPFHHCIKGWSWS